MEVKELRTVRISRIVLREIKKIQVEDNFPIYANDSLVLSLACFRLFEEIYRSERLSKKDKEEFRKAILDDIEIMIDENFVDDNPRGYDKE